MLELHRVFYTFYSDNLDRYDGEISESTGSYGSDEKVEQFVSTIKDCCGKVIRGTGEGDRPDKKTYDIELYRTLRCSDASINKLVDLYIAISFILVNNGGKLLRAEDMGDVFGVTDFKPAVRKSDLHKPVFVQKYDLHKVVWRSLQPQEVVVDAGDFSIIQQPGGKTGGTLIDYFGLDSIANMNHNMTTLDIASRIRGRHELYHLNSVPRPYRSSDFDKHHFIETIASSPEEAALCRQRGEFYIPCY
jgi:hypothetical protein